MNTPNIADLATLTPVAIDTELARLWNEGAALEGRIASYKSYLNDLTTDRRTKKPRDMKPWEEKDRDRYLAEIAAAGAALAANREETNPFTDEFTRRGGWNRYFLVTNASGHVHREMTCSTCYPETHYAWLIDLADCDEGAMIEEWGEKACTVCFPGAPTNPAFNRPARIDREAKEKRLAEKLAREAAKKAKAITAPDGTPLRIPDGDYTNYRTGVTETRYETIATKVAASRALSAAIKDFGWYGPTHPNRFAEKVPMLVEALEAAGIDTAPIVARAKKAVAKDGGKFIFPG